MCLFKAPKSVALPQPPPIKPRIDTDTTLPTAKPTVDKDATASIKYGTGQKEAGPASGKRTGTDSLKINLNTGDDTGSKTGGVNV